MVRSAAFHRPQNQNPRWSQVVIQCDARRPELSPRGQPSEEHTTSKRETRNPRRLDDALRLASTAVGAMGCCAKFCTAIAVALIAVVAQYCYFHVGLPNWWWKARMPPEIEAVDVEDTALLKKILFSGEPWLLQCYSGLPFEGQHLPAPYRLHPAFVESLGTMRGLVRGGTLDCEKKMPSNKTLVSKFGLIRRTQPLLLYAGGGDKPKQVPAASAESAYGVTAWVKPKAEPKVRVATSQKALDAYCGGRRGCLLTRLPADSPVLEQLARRFRTVEVVSVREGDTLSWGRGEEVGETLEPEEAVHFGQPTSLMRADPDAPRPTRKGARPPRTAQGLGGSGGPPLPLALPRQGPRRACGRGRRRVRPLAAADDHDQGAAQEAEGGQEAEDGGGGRRHRRRGAAGEAREGARRGAQEGGGRREGARGDGQGEDRGGAARDGAAAAGADGGGGGERGEHCRGGGRRRRRRRRWRGRLRFRRGRGGRRL